MNTEHNEKDMYADSPTLGTSTKKILIGWGIALVVLCASGAYIYLSNNAKDAENGKGNGAGQIIDTSIDTDGSDLIKQTPNSELPDTTPALERSTSGLAPSPDMVKSIQNAVATLKKNPGSFDDWILLGIYRKQIGDYEGALLAWEFAIKVRPDDAIPKNNIGMLYYLYLKDYPKAEEILLATTKTNPAYTATFQNLFELYQNAYKKGTGADEQILLTGIKANPESVELMMLLASHYVDGGRKAEAKKYYEKVLTLTKDDTDFQGYVKGLLAGLK